MEKNVLMGLRGDWSRWAALFLIPPLVLTFGLWLHFPSWTRADAFVKANWGNIASAWGLAIGLYVLIVAQGARRAAEQATEQTMQLGRVKGLLEELGEANKKIQQVGIFIGQRKWDLVNHVTTEILVSCTGMVARWNDLQGVSSNTLLDAVVLIRSMARSATANVSEDQREVHARRLGHAQIKAAELLSTALGQVRQQAERKGK